MRHMRKSRPRKPPFYRTISEIADEHAVSELLGRVNGKDPIAGYHTSHPGAFQHPRCRPRSRGC